LHFDYIYVLHILSPLYKSLFVIIIFKAVCNYLLYSTRGYRIPPYIVCILNAPPPLLIRFTVIMYNIYSVHHCNNNTYCRLYRYMCIYIIMISWSEHFRLINGFFITMILPTICFFYLIGTLWNLIVRS